MSASEKLKVIEAEEFASPWLYDQPGVEGDFRDALPQIVALAREAEYYLGETTAGRPALTIGLEQSLAALDEALP